MTLPFDSAEAQAYAVIASRRVVAGRPINHADCEIVAVSRCQEASVVIRDVDDFEGD